MAQGIQNIISFCVKGFLVLWGIGLLINFFDSRKENRYKKARSTRINDKAKTLVDALTAALRANNHNDYVRLCDQAVAEGLGFNTRKEIAEYFNRFKAAGFQYPERGRYADQYGITFLWVIIFSAWRDQHPNAVD